MTDRAMKTKSRLHIKGTGPGPFLCHMPRRAYSYPGIPLSDLDQARQDGHVICGFCLRVLRQKLKIAELTV